MAKTHEQLVRALLGHLEVLCRRHLHEGDAMILAGSFARGDSVSVRCGRGRRLLLSDVDLLLLSDSAFPEARSEVLRSHALRFLNESRPWKVTIDTIATAALEDALERSDLYGRELRSHGKVIFGEAPATTPKEVDAFLTKPLSWVSASFNLLVATPAAGCGQSVSHSFDQFWHGLHKLAKAVRSLSRATSETYPSQGFREWASEFRSSPSIPCELEGRGSAWKLSFVALQREIAAYLLEAYPSVVGAPLMEWTQPLAGGLMLLGEAGHPAGSEALRIANQFERSTLANGSWRW